MLAESAVKAVEPYSPRRADSYRELALQASNSAVEYKARASRYAELGDAQIAAECKQLYDEALARAKRYTVLADFAERNG